MNQTRNKIFLSLFPALCLFSLSACESESIQRDIYTRMEDCIADWGDPALCLEVAKVDAEQFAQQSLGTNASGHIPMLFWGPGYYPGHRSVDFNGKQITPKTNHAMSRPFVVTSSSSTNAKTSPAKPVSRGGFGKSGSSAGRSGG